MIAYQLMSDKALQEECKRLEAIQHKYAKAGMVLMSSVYAGKLVTAVMVLAHRPLAVRSAK